MVLNGLSGLLEAELQCPNCEESSSFRYIPYLQFGDTKLSIKLYECEKCKTKTTYERLKGYNELYKVAKHFTD